MFANAKNFIDNGGLKHVGFLTLTPPDQLEDRKEASRRFKSLATNELNKRYPMWMRVFERQDSGRIHYHLLVECGGDIRTGFDWHAYTEAKKAWKAGNLALHRHYTAIYAKSASDSLRAEWAFWRNTAGGYGWGRCEILPIRTNAEAAARYIGSYITKHIGRRELEDKGAQIFGCSEGARIASLRFSWNTPRAWLWRKKLARWAASVGCESLEEIKAKFGPKWGYHYREAIMTIDLGPITYPTAAHALADGVLNDRDLIELSDAGADLEGPITVPQSANTPF